MRSRVLIATTAIATVLCIGSPWLDYSAPETKFSTIEPVKMSLTSETPTQESEEIQEAPKFFDVPLSEELQIHIFEECEKHNIAPAIVIAMIERESSFREKVVGDNGDSLGLMQIQTKWHKERMEKLGCTDLLNPHENIMVGIDFLAELLERYEGDVTKALTAYNSGKFRGTVTKYASGIIERAEHFEKEKNNGY
jgi:hypothetical protein